MPLLFTYLSFFSLFSHFIYFLISIHSIRTRNIKVVKFVYAERLALYLLDILFTYFYERIKNNELKVGSIINPTPVYLEQH